MEMAAKNKLIIALDDMDMATALHTVRITKEYASTYKIGLTLFTAHGPSLLREVNALGCSIFLDLKFHDIPMQVAKAVEAALQYFPKYLTVHAMGGCKMLREAAAAARGSSTNLLAVSVLTSFAQEDLREIGNHNSIDDAVTMLTDGAYRAGIRGFVASPLEIANLRKRFSDAILVAPGVRPTSADAHDQTRITTPKNAIMFGADALVIGRPITKAHDVARACRNIHDEIAESLVQK